MCASRSFRSVSYFQVRDGFFFFFFCVIGCRFEIIYIYIYICTRYFFFYCPFFFSLNSFRCALFSLKSQRQQTRKDCKRQAKCSSRTYEEDLRKGEGNTHGRRCIAGFGTNGSLVFFNLSFCLTFWLAAKKKKAHFDCLPFLSFFFFYCLQKLIFFTCTHSSCVSYRVIAYSLSLIFFLLYNITASTELPTVTAFFL